MEPRSLFEQLQEQKEKTQQEHDEKYDISKISNFNLVADCYWHRIDSNTRSITSCQHI